MYLLYLNLKRFETNFVLIVLTMKCIPVILEPQIGRYLTKYVYKWKCRYGKIKSVSNGSIGYNRCPLNTYSYQLIC